MTLKIQTILLGLVFCFNLHALQPVESLVLGDFSADYNENKTDPLEYVFGRDFSNNGQSIDQFKKDTIQEAIEKAVEYVRGKKEC